MSKTPPPDLGQLEATLARIETSYRAAEVRWQQAAAQMRQDWLAAWTAAYEQRLASGEDLELLELVKTEDLGPRLAEGWIRGEQIEQPRVQICSWRDPLERGGGEAWLGSRIQMRRFIPGGEISPQQRILLAGHLERRARDEAAHPSIVGMAGFCSSLGGLRQEIAAVKKAEGALPR